MSVRLYYCNRIIIIARVRQKIVHEGIHKTPKTISSYGVISVTFSHFYYAWNIDSSSVIIRCAILSRKVIPSKEKSRGNSILIRRNRITGYILNYSNLIYFTACFYLRSFKATIALASLKLTLPILAEFSDNKVNWNIIEK